MATPRVARPRRLRPLDPYYYDNTYLNGWLVQMELNIQDALERATGYQWPPMTYASRMQLCLRAVVEEGGR